MKTSQIIAWRSLGLPLVALCVFVAGCNTVDSVKTTRGTGKSETYAADFKTTWAAVPLAVKAAGLEVAETDEPNRTITAASGMGLFSYGERVALFVEPVDAQTTRIEVVSKRVLATNLTAKNWTEPLLAELAKQLPLAKR